MAHGAFSILAASVCTLIFISSPDTKPRSVPLEHFQVQHVQGGRFPPQKLKMCRSVILNQSDSAPCSALRYFQICFRVLHNVGIVRCANLISDLLWLEFFEQKIVLLFFFNQKKKSDS